MIDEIAKALIGNAEKISIILLLIALVGFSAKIISELIKGKDNLHTKMSEIHEENAKNLVSLNEKTIGGLDSLAIAIDKQSVEISTLIKFGLKDK